MLADQPGFQRQFSRPGRGAAAQGSRSPAWTDLQASVARRQARLANLPRPKFDLDLPILLERDRIAKAITQHQVVVVCGATGSGKTTQLPKICLDIGRGVAGMIGHTQPRRIAARAVAARIAAELESPLGQTVGYKVRFDDQLDSNAYLKLMTDGILLAETQRDSDLLQYDTIIVDEAHERSLNIDFLLGYLRQLLPRRPDLKLIITSATIDPQSFSRHFDNAPIIEVSGRAFPIDVRYRPVESDEPDEEDPTVLQAILTAVDEIVAIDIAGTVPGDILIFLSGEREIRETTEALRKRFQEPSFELLPLYARLSTEQQDRIFQPHSGRRIVLATNVAETSLTVPGIRYVIDPGFARISRYSANARVQRLPIETISRASAQQRAGRCGRVAPGVCIRLYSQNDFEDRAEYTDPEILRSNLANVILQMKFLKLGEIERFPFIQPPRPGMVREGYQTLHELGALDEQGVLTALGSQLAQLPIDPRLGRMIIAARGEQCVAETLIIVSALATQDPRLRPLDVAQQADAAQAQFADERSDFLSYLKLWEFYRQSARDLSTSKLRKLCPSHFLSYVRLREWHDVHRQLHAMVRRAGLSINQTPATYENIHRALLAGLLTNIGIKGENHEYLGVRDRKFNIFPASALFKSAPKWIMAAEMVQTTRLYARTVARIQPEWVERLAGHLLKRSYTAPHWNAKSAHVEAYEKVTLQGLTIVPKRRVHFGKLDPDLSRELFIQHALVEGQFQTRAPFFQHNRDQVAEVCRHQAKTRRRDLSIDSDQQFAFYDQRIPRGIMNGPLFEKWRAKAERDDPQLLFMSRDDLVPRHARLADADSFPDSIPFSGLDIHLDYRFEPGHPEDGLTLIVPLEAMKYVQPQQADWLVPGLLREKTIALIKSLPKEMRRHFVPAPDVADACLRTIEFGQGALTDQLAAALGRLTEVRVPSTAWNPSALPDNLRPNYRVIDSEGAALAHGRDWDALRRQLGPQAERQLASSLRSEHDRDFITTWDFGDMLDRGSVEIRRRSTTWRAFPALIDKGKSVSLQMVENQAEARIATRAGIRRLFVLQVDQELAMQVEYLPNFDQMVLHFAPLGTSHQLKADLIDLIADRAFLGDLPPILTQVEFERRLRSRWENLWPAARDVGDLIGRILEGHHQLDVQLAGIDNPLLVPALDDIRFQLKHLLADRFLLTTPLAWLEHFPRFLKAIATRLRKLSSGGLARDQQAISQIQEHWDKFDQRRQQHQLHGLHDPELERYRWMIEELRVSLFSQELGTSIPVSVKRLNAQWDQVQG